MDVRRANRPLEQNPEALDVVGRIGFPVPPIVVRPVLLRVRDTVRAPITLQQAIGHEFVSRDGGTGLHIAKRHVAKRGLLYVRDHDRAYIAAAFLGLAGWRAPRANLLLNPPSSAPG